MPTEYELGIAVAHLTKQAAAATTTYCLTGRLFASASGWILLSVPNAFVRGLFDTLQEPGLELPPNFSAHISVMRPNEVKELGGVNKITERGHVFKYQIGPMKTVQPAGWPEISKVWFVSVESPELKQLRKSYGLSALPLKDGEEIPFHITVAIRKKRILQENEVKKSNTTALDSVLDKLLRISISS